MFSGRTVLNWIAHKNFPAVKVGKFWRLNCLKLKAGLRYRTNLSEGVRMDPFIRSYKLKNLLNKARARIILIFSLPTVWVSFIILVCAIASIVISENLYLQKKTFESSVFSNIFAGLIAGFALSILSGTKAVYFSYMEERYAWLEETHTMLLEFIKMYRELLSTSKLSNKEFSDKAYDTGARADWVNERIMQGTFDRAKWIDPPKYFFNHYNYDCMKMCVVLGEFRETLISASVDSSQHKEDIGLFEPVVNIMMNLNSKVLDDMKLIKIKLAKCKKVDYIGMVI